MNRLLLALSLCLVISATAIVGPAAAASVNFGPPTASPGYFGAPARKIALGQAGNETPQLDLFTAYGTFGNSTVQVRKTNVAGQWHPLVTNTASVQNIGSLNSPMAMAIGDVNADGFDDIGAASTGGVQLARGASNGAFGAFASPAGSAFSASTGVAFAQMNVDALPDMIVATTTALQVFFNTGNTTAPFNTFNSIPTGFNIADIAVADFDGDGDQDIATTSPTDNRALLYVNSGGFANPVSIGLFTRPGALDAADVNGDGKIELLVTEPDRGTVAIVSTGLLPASLGPASRIATGLSPLHVDTADLDADGKPEIVTANAASDTVTVASVGGTTNSFSAGTSPTSVALGEVTGDGLPDIVVSNDATLNVSILANLGAPPAPPPPAALRRASVTCSYRNVKKSLPQVACKAKLSNPADAKSLSATLLRGKRKVASAKAKPGKTLTFKLKRRLAAGRYSIKLTVTNLDGSKLSANRTLRVK